MDANRRGISPALPILALAALVALAAGCTKRSAESGALPATDVSVGPVPGPPTKAPTMDNPLENDPQALQDGRRLFNFYNCSGCHGDHGGGGMGPSLRDSVWIYGSSPGQIYSTIVHGRAHGMPSWGPRIPQRQVWSLVTYIQSLNTSSEPDPPH